ncbi:MAG: hypothetical protein ACR2NB_11985 [Solirubrobacteraceae bacterium]
MTARRLIGILAFVLWAVLASLTCFVLLTAGPDVLVLISLVIVLTMGAGIFGALHEKRGGPR